MFACKLSSVGNVDSQQKVGVYDVCKTLGPVLSYPQLTASSSPLTWDQRRTPDYEAPVCDGMYGATRDPESGAM